jgi:hypothetical protein
LWEDNCSARIILGKTKKRESEDIEEKEWGAKI